MNAKAYDKQLTFDRQQVTFNGTQQNDTVIFDDTIYYSDWRNNVDNEIDIYSFNLKTKTESPVVLRHGLKAPAAANNNYLIYNEYLGTNNWYDIRILNLKTGEDKVILEGSDNQFAWDLYHNWLTYTVGFGATDTYLYNINTGESIFLSNNAQRPKIWGDTVVWVESAGGGSANAVGYNLRNNTKYYLPSTSNGKQSWPDIYKEEVVWEGMYDEQGIFLKDLRTGEETKIANTGDAPAIWGDFVTWVDISSGNHDVFAYDMKTGDTVQLSNFGAEQPSSTIPAIYKNTIAWMSWTTGNGDIYAAELSRK